MTKNYISVASQYIDDVLSEKTVACQYVKQACKRQLNDLKRKSWGYTFDAKAASRVCRFCELLQHAKGPKAGQHIALEPWQIFVLTTVFGWKDKETGYRRFQDVYIEVPRGNGKSTLLSCIGLYMLCADGEKGADVYSFATTRDQAKIVFGDAQFMARQNKDLREAYGLQVLANQMVVPGTNSKFQAKSADGSPLALMVAAYKAQDTSGELWCIPQTISKATAASGSIAVTGTALASGTIALYISGVKVPVTVATGDNATAVETALIAAINANKDLPVSATDNEGVAVLNAKVGGVWGNDIQIATNLQGTVGGESDVSGINVKITAMANGAGEADYAAAFATVNTEAFWYIGIQDCDATVLDACKNEMNDSTGRWSYARMQYGHVWSAKRGDTESLINFGKTRNDQHASVFGVESGNPNLPCVIAAAVTGRAAVFFTNDPARPLQTGILSGLMMPSVEKRFSFTDRNSLLHNGIATCYHMGGYTRIEREITTYQTNSFGDADNSYLDATTLYTLAEIVSELKTAITSKYARHKLANDGTRFGAGQAIVTPKVIRSELIAQYASMENRGLVENADLFAKYLVVERDTTDVNRLNVLLPPDLVNQLRVFALLAQFRLQYSEE